MQRAFMEYFWQELVLVNGNQVIYVWMLMLGRKITTSAALISSAHLLNTFHSHFFALLLVVLLLDCNRIVVQERIKVTIGIGTPLQGNSLVIKVSGSSKSSSCLTFLRSFFK